MLKQPLFLLSSALLLLIAGCAQQPINPVENWQGYQRQLQALEDWQLKGKIGLRIENDSDSANVTWTNSAANYAIRLSGPLGRGTTWIRGNDKSVRIEQAGEEPISAATPEDLVYQTLGWEIPVSDLQYWVRGIPSPRSPIEQAHRAETGLLMNLEQAGWAISYDNYQGVGPWNLPGRITAQRGELELRLVRLEWQIPDTTTPKLSSRQ